MAEKNNNKSGAILNGVIGFFALMITLFIVYAIFDAINKDLTQTKGDKFFLILFILLSISYIFLTLLNFYGVYLHLKKGYFKFSYVIAFSPIICGFIHLIIVIILSIGSFVYETKPDNIDAFDSIILVMLVMGGIPFVIFALLGFFSLRTTHNQIKPESTNQNSIESFE